MLNELLDAIIDIPDQKEKLKIIRECMRKLHVDYRSLMVMIKARMKERENSND